MPAPCPSSRSSRSPWAGSPGGEHTGARPRRQVESRVRGALLQHDLAGKRHAKIESRDFERHRGRKALAAEDAARGDRFCNFLLDRALRIDADHLQKFSDAEIEGFFIHRDLRWLSELAF